MPEIDSTSVILKGMHVNCSVWSLEGSPHYIIIEVAVVQFVQVKLLLN